MSQFIKNYALLVVLIVLVLPDLMFFIGLPLGCLVLIPNQLPWIVTKIIIAAVLIGAQMKFQKE